MSGGRGALSGIGYLSRERRNSRWRPYRHAVRATSPASAGEAFRLRHITAAAIHFRCSDAMKHITFAYDIVTFCNFV